MIEIRQMPLGPMQTNCYLVCCGETLQAAVIDPSFNGPGIQATAEEAGWVISHILLTHAHFDHVGGLADLKELTGAPIYIHPDAVAMLKEAAMSAAFFGLRWPPTPPPDEMLAEGQVITVGNLRLTVLYTPGHAPGHVSFHLANHRVLFDGDVLFQGSIGRTDLPGGDHDRLLQSIREQFLVLPDDTRVFSGHGPPTTIGAEKQHNPFLS